MNKVPNRRLEVQWLTGLAIGRLGEHDEPTSRDAIGARFKNRVKLGPGIRLPATGHRNA